MEKIIVIVLVIVVILLLVFLILREVMCWYWKVNERIILQRETNTLLRKLIDKEVVTIHTEGKISSDKKTSSGKLFCTNCGYEYEIGTEYCPKCLRKTDS